MVKKANIRRVFPGANTYKGFYSFYDYILPQDEASRIFILKGGPGTGKSTFIKRIASDIINLGLDIECHHCSSDNDSLDGVVIPSLKVAVVDGTAPHIVDPKAPGAVDEIVNLGECWDETKLMSSRDEILKYNNRIARLFNIAYSHLKEAKIAYDEWESYMEAGIDKIRYNEILGAMLRSIFEDVSANYESPPKVRHLFASAITPGGIKNYIDTLIDSRMKSYSIEGEPGTGVKKMIQRIAQSAYEKGLFTEQFHCPFDPDSVDMVIIPEINIAVLNMSKPFHYNVSKINGLRFEDRVNLNVCIQKKEIEDYEVELEDAKRRFYYLIASAIEHFSQAKSMHDKVENFYKPAMDFKMIEEKRQEVLKKILKYKIE